MVLSALIYQPSAFFYLVPLAAALIAQRRRSLAQSARWVGIHLGFVAGTLGLAYCTMSLLYAEHVFVKSGRIAFESHWGEKIAWFLQEPLPNALSLFVLNDNNHRNHALYFGCAALVGAILIAGAYLEWRRHGMQRGIVWLSGLLGLPVFAFAVCLLASERYATYRTILAMTGVLLCFLVASIGALTERWSANARRLAAMLAISIAFFTAQHHVYALIAVPQGNEWQLIMAGAKQVHLDGVRPRIFAIASAPADISTATIYHDEFGSLSSNSEWVPREMFKRAMHDLHPSVADLDSRYDFATGPVLPVAIVSVDGGRRRAGLLHAWPHLRSHRANSDRMDHRLAGGLELLAQVLCRSQRGESCIVSLVGRCGHRHDRGLYHARRQCRRAANGHLSGRNAAAQNGIRRHCRCVLHAAKSIQSAFHGGSRADHHPKFQLQSHAGAGRAARGAGRPLASQACQSEPVRAIGVVIECNWGNSVDPVEGGPKTAKA